MLVLQAFPVLAVVVAAYNFVVVLGSRAVGDVLRQVTLPSGDVWPITVGDVLIGTAIVLVLIEFASLGSGRASVVNHALSAIVFVICVVELLFIRGCGTAEFAVITLIVALDVVPAIRLPHAWRIAISNSTGKGEPGGRGLERLGSQASSARQKASADDTMRAESLT